MRSQHLKDYYHPAKCRHEALQYVKLSDLAILQFGVFSGSSMAVIHEYLNDGIGYSKMWGFDSFEGLPVESQNIPIDSDWPQGAFNAIEWFEANNAESVVKHLEKEFVDFGIPFYKFELIKGFFADSLTDELAQIIGKVSYIDVDSDLYISCYQALDWVFRNNMQVQGTVIYFDDYRAGKDCKGGEWRAFNELAEKYRIGYQWLYEGGSWALIVK